ncbi:nuclear transport factor 2 family protein [Kribbella italica]|uniref:Ketosteroid isomerase-like protein n=1 Tax=Kribbella italica TaxID=1540520 RepID=A0A7W9J5Q5_9ACTN|nr:nuclear transport factor 2 family protein [Kribbella italica]MBB5835880.1 ketosteroid isomerase-like protein [Kribbella italica]
MTARADQFAVALNKLDETGDARPIAQLFADDAELTRPQLRDDPAGGPEPFWTAYQQQFHDLATSFTRIEEVGDLAVLEWSSQGRLATGRPIQYAGVSVLNFDDTDRIVRFATYFDTAAFTMPTSQDTD